MRFSLCLILKLEGSQLVLVFFKNDSKQNQNPGETLHSSLYILHNTNLAVRSTSPTHQGPSCISCPHHWHVQMSAAQQNGFFSGNYTKWRHSQGVSMSLDFFFFFNPNTVSYMATSFPLSLFIDQSNHLFQQRPPAAQSVASSVIESLTFQLQNNTHPSRREHFKMGFKTGLYVKMDKGRRWRLQAAPKKPGRRNCC